MKKSKKDKKENLAKINPMTIPEHMTNEDVTNEESNVKFGHNLDDEEAREMSDDEVVAKFEPSPEEKSVNFNKCYIEIALCLVLTFFVSLFIYLFEYTDVLRQRPEK